MATEIKYAVVCKSSTGWFEIQVQATSHARAIDRAANFIELNGWDGQPVRAHRAW